MAYMRKRKKSLGWRLDREDVFETLAILFILAAMFGICVLLYSI